MPAAGSFFDDDFDEQLKPGTLGAKSAVAAPQAPLAPLGGNTGDQPAPPVVSTPMAPLAPKPAAPVAPPKPAGMSQEQRRQRQLDAQRGIGVNWRSDENQDDPVFKAKQVLSQELEGGHFDPLPGSNLFYSYGADGMRFKDANGREFRGTPQQESAALSDMSSWSDSYNAAQPGGGSGGGVGGGVDDGGGAGGSGTSFESQIETLLSGIMSGQNTRFNDDTVRSMKAQAVEDTAGAVESQNKALQRAAARKGLTYSGSTEAEAAENRRAGGREQSRALRTIDTNKAQADFEDKMAGADRALALVEQRRQEKIANAKNATDIRRIEAETAAARERIAADKAMLRDKLAQESAITQKGYDAERASGRANRDWQDANAVRNREWEVEDARRREALELARLGLAGG